MQINTERFVELCTHLNMIWSAPLQIILCIIMLWSYLGIASLAGLATMITIVPINVYLSNKQKIYLTKKLKYQDSRIKLTSEILSGIKVLKFYAWEQSFHEIINKLREKELNALLKIGIYQALINMILGIASFMVNIFNWIRYMFNKIKVMFALIKNAAFSFAVYILINEKNDLDPSTAFVSLTLFNIIKFPLLVLPNLISSLIQVK